MHFDQICGFANKTSSVSDGGKSHNLCSALHNVVSFDTTLCSAEQRLCLTILTSHPPIVANCTPSSTLTSLVNNRLTLFQYKNVMGLILPSLVWESKSRNTILCTELGVKDRNMLEILHRTGREGQKYAWDFAQNWAWRTEICLRFCTELGMKDRNVLLHRTGCEGQKYAWDFAQNWAWRTEICLQGQKYAWACTFAQN